MRFVDWNGTGGVDAQDIVTSVVLDETRPGDGDDGHPGAKSDSIENSTSTSTYKSGCMTSVIGCLVMAITIGTLACLS